MVQTTNTLLTEGQFACIKKQAPNPLLPPANLTWSQKLPTTDKDISKIMGTMVTLYENTSINQAEQHNFLKKLSKVQQINNTFNWLFPQ